MFWIQLDMHTSLLHETKWTLTLVKSCNQIQILLYLKNEISLCKATVIAVMNSQGVSDPDVRYFVLVGDVFMCDNQYQKESNNRPKDSKH